MRNIRVTIKLFVTAFVLAFVFAASGLNSFAESTATVSVESAYIRASASTSGDIVAGAMKNDKLSIIETVTDSAGNTWYKVWVDSKTTGYIRSDLVTTSGDVPASSGNSGSETSTSTSTSTETSTSTSVSQTPVDPTPIIGPELVSVNEVAGKTTGDVRVRKGPSTSTAVVDNVSKGTEVTVTGYEETSDGETWYYLTYGAKAGYIRSDFVSLSGELVVAGDETEEEPAPEPAPEPEPEPEPEVYMDYEVVYELDDNGDTVWYLRDYTEGTKNEVTELLEAKKKLEESTKDYEKRLKKKQTGIVVLSIVVVLLIAGAGVAYFFFYRWYFGYDETEEPILPKKESVSRSSSSSSYSSRSQSSRGHTGRSEQDFKMETVGAKPSASQSGPTRLTRQDLEGAEFLEDGEHIRLSDGRIVKATRAKKTSDGGYATNDGTTRYSDGRSVTPGASSQSTTSVPRTAPKARPITEDDDMAYGFLHSGSSHDDD